MSSRGLRALVLLACSCVAPTLVARDFEKDAVALRRLHETLSPSVVQVRVALRRESTAAAEIDVETEAIGLVVDAHGLVMVPASVADGDGAAAPRVTVVEVFVAGGARYEARWLGKARGASVAFCQVDDPSFASRPVEFAADDSMQVGDFVASVRLSGPNFRRAAFIDAFMVSGMLDDPRCGLTSFAASDYLGSCVATLDGRVIGIIGWMSMARSSARDPVTGAMQRSVLAAVHGEDPTGRELVIVPASAVREAIEAGPDPESAPHVAPFLGMDVQALPRELATWFELKPERSAARVSRVWPDTPAAAAGFAVGDLVVGVDGEELAFARDGDTSELSAYVKAKRPGDTLVFDVVRGKRRVTVTATLAAAPMPIEESPRATCDAFGVHARDLVFGDRAEAGLPQSTPGARTTAVSRSGHLGQAGLFVGDIVLRVDDQPVADAASLCAALTVAAEARAERVTLFVQRGRRTLFVHARPEWEREAAR